MAEDDSLHNTSGSHLETMSRNNRGAGLSHGSLLASRMVPTVLRRLLKGLLFMAWGASAVLNRLLFYA